MQIAILGKGNVGLALARAFHAAGHAVTLGVRDPSTAPAELPADTVAGAVSGAELVVLAVPARAVDAVLDAAGDLSGVVVVDATNPVAWDDGPVHAPPAEGSVSARIAALRPQARVVKAFNTFGAEFHRQPTVAGQPVTVLLAGDDAGAKATVSELAGASGWAPVDAGPLRNAAALEQHACLWIHLAMKGGLGRRFTFQVVHDG